MITAKVLPDRGLVRISGTSPNGNAVIERLSQGANPFLLRGGTFPVATQGFTLEDSEAPLGIPLSYRASITPTNRLIQRNLVKTPDFTHGLQTWTVGTSRTITTSTDTASGRTIGTISASSTGTVRIIAEVGTEALVPGQRYLVTGRARFRTPGVWTWQDVKNFGTWQQVKTAKANWAAVRSSVAVPTGDSYATLYFNLALGATEYTVPVKVFENSMASTGQWVNFSTFITAPVGLPATARLRLLHGTTTREYSIAWDLDQFSVYSEADGIKPYRLIWFSGDTTVPDQPQSYLTQETGWEDISQDSSITWEGAAGNSVSRFTGPSIIAESVTTKIDPPGNAPCEPILLSDPVSTALSQWFSLAKVSALSREARITVLAVLGRSDFVSTSSMRGSPKGTLTLYTSTLEERKQALSIFASGRILLLRNPNPSYPETSWYLAIGNVEEDRTIEQDARKPNRTWTIPFVVVERPTGLIEASSGITWGDIKASGMTWRELRDRRSSWLDVALVDL